MKHNPATCALFFFCFVFVFVFLLSFFILCTMWLVDWINVLASYTKMKSACGKGQCVNLKTSRDAHDFVESVY